MIVYPNWIPLFRFSGWLLVLSVLCSQRDRQHLDTSPGLCGSLQCGRLWTVLFRAHDEHPCAGPLDLSGLFPGCLQMSHVLYCVAYFIRHQQSQSLPPSCMLGLCGHLCAHLRKHHALRILWLLLQRCCSQHVHDGNHLVGRHWCQHAFPSLVW